MLEYVFISIIIFLLLYFLSYIFKEKSQAFQSLRFIFSKTRSCTLILSATAPAFCKIQMILNSVNFLNAPLLIPADVLYYLLYPSSTKESCCKYYSTYCPVCKHTIPHTNGSHTKYSYKCYT